MFFLFCSDTPLGVANITLALGVLTEHFVEPHVSVQIHEELVRHFSTETCLAETLSFAPLSFLQLRFDCSNLIG
jgi:hypothetical protein